jgi:hypothetical protein
MITTDVRPKGPKEGRKSVWRPAALATIGIAVLVAVGLGVWATLSAIATGTETVSTGTLSLTMAPNGVGFSQNVTNMAPGDQVNRYVELTNGGTLDARDLTMLVGATGDARLITDNGTTLALRVTVTGCSGSWAPTTGVCTGTQTVLLAATPLSGLSPTPVSVLAGAIASNVVQHLQVKVTLPDQTEVTVNGTPPAATIQALSATLTYTFGETQRTAATTNS